MTSLDIAQGVYELEQALRSHTEKRSFLQRDINRIQEQVTECDERIARIKTVIGCLRDFDERGTFEPVPEQG
jgi:chromosome segregation ATPase